MRSFAINTLFSLGLFICFFAAIPSVQAAIPNKRVCIQNDKGQPLMYKGQGLWVKHNNATGTFWTKQGGTDGCANFPDGDENVYDKNKAIDGNFDGTPELFELMSEDGGNGDLGCASGPFGFQVVMPKEWEANWECQTVGSVKGPFPCCRSPQERDDPELRPAGGCNDCKVHNPGYEGKYEEIACYCDRSAHNNLPDYQCPICFHNDGATVNVVLQCRSKKTNQSKLLDSPMAEQFGIKKTQGVACITTEVCAKKEDGTSNCSTTPEAGAMKHRVRLSNVKDLQQKLTKRDPAKPVYIVECVMNGTSEDDANYICTTGDASLDSTVFGQNNLAQLAGYGYSAKIFTEKGENKVDNKPLVQPFTDTSLNLDNYEWETTTTKAISSVFTVVYEQTSSTAISSSDIAAQKQSQLSFADACTLIIDPYGRTFDTKTLEPLPGTQITLKDDTNSLGVTQTTKEDGTFSFYTKPGTYTLAVSKPGYRFPASMVPNPLAGKLYKNYYDGSSLVVKDEIIYTDIPLEPEDKTASENFARQNNPKIMEYFQSVDPSKEIYRIQGRVSHPRSTVVVYGHVPHPAKNGTQVRSRAIARGHADEYGRFDIQFPQSKLLTREVVGELEVVKSKEYYLNNTRTAIPLNPILSEVKGYAYDANRNIISGAKVALMVPFSKEPLVETVADEKGFFVIPAESVPPVPYKIHFTSMSGAVDVVSTQTFLANNSTRDPYSYVAANTQGILDNVLGVSDNNGSNDNDPFTQADRQLPNSTVLVVFFIILILSGIPLYRLYSKKEPDTKKK